MHTEMTLSYPALLALLALCDEAIKEGGCPPSTTLEAVAAAREVLGLADRIIVEEPSK